MHDDIMDEALIRRGKTTIHHKWDVNTGILSGDALMILAYQFFENYEGVTFKKIVSLFNKTALEVCEGQQYDMDFETRTDVSLEEYKKMIGYKTAVLIAAALKMGAIIANADKNEADLIYDFGYNLGMAFQLQDDFLDTFGSKDFGKKIGGDISENKKTFLVIKTLELADDDDRKVLSELFSDNEFNSNKIDDVTGLFKIAMLTEASCSDVFVTKTSGCFKSISTVAPTPSTTFKTHSELSAFIGRIPRQFQSPLPGKI